ncbi:NfeD family protein [Proteus sp. DFP240708]|uniref:NfeD family protein n=2 Tax=Proteus TaxID=583 RepID=A0A6I7D3G9_9GAMM|nr:MULTISPECIES: NfeD family protein [Proteus]MBG2803024.1 NfeD family protein [Proteus mirabilis]MBG3020869.1 NfeD family protein [Proteus mirabilis]MBG3152628.1 NfeD family protein [Proteus mirabilis]MBI6217913.1 NfeD family protein [Proteus vulgaris]MBI6338201.1 NfeD family protein [Proteus sp. PR00224]
MIEWISAQPALFWLCLGGLLLITEMLGTAGYLLWSGMAALCVSLITWILPISWPIQGILFAILTVISALLWHLWLKRRKLSKEAENLNQKTHQLIGVHAVLLSDTENGFSRVKLADGSWRVYSDTPLLAGDKVTVTAIDGITLQVIALKSAVSGDDNTLTND